MTNWETGFTNKQEGTKFTGNDRMVNLLEPLWIKGARLIMKSSKVYISFSSINFFTQQYTVQINDKYDPNLCLSRSDNNFNKNRETLHVVNCIDAIAMGDSREVFVIDVDWQIKSFFDETCL